jgi:hypothetical protein
LIRTATIILPLADVGKKYIRQCPTGFWRWWLQEERSGWIYLSFMEAMRCDGMQGEWVGDACENVVDV